jgi:hypothetical protein
MAAYTKTSALIASGLLSGCSIAGTDVGYLGSKFAVKQEVTTTDLKSGCIHSPVGNIQNVKKFTLDLSFAEYSFANVATALCQLSTAVGSSGSYLLLDTVQSTAVAIYVEYYNEQELKYHLWYFPTCKQASGATLTYDAENQGFMDVTFDITPLASGKAGMCTLAATSHWA